MLFAKYYEKIKKDCLQNNIVRGGVVNVQLKL